MPSVVINTEPVAGLARAMREAPDVLLVELTKAFAAIADSDTAINRADLAKRLKSRRRSGNSRVENTIKSVASTVGRPKSINQLFVTEFTRWQALGIFQTGGVISGAEQLMTVLTDAGRQLVGGQGSAAKLRQLVASGQALLVRTPRGLLVILADGGLTRTGRPKASPHETVLAVLRKEVTEVKRLEFFENVERNDGAHTDLLETAVENTFAELLARNQPS